VSIFNLPGLVMRIDRTNDGWTFSAAYGGGCVWGENRATSTECYLEIVDMVSRIRGAFGLA
jgi:hypothetical protein